MKQNTPYYVAVVDLGTSCIRLIVAKHEGGERTIMDIGSVAHKGIDRGVIIDSASTAYAIKEAINILKNKLPDIQINRIYTSIGGYSLLSMDQALTHNNIKTPISFETLSELDKNAIASMTQEHKVEVLSSYTTNFYYEGKRIDTPINKYYTSLKVFRRFFVCNPSSVQKLKATFSAAKVQWLKASPAPELTARFLLNEAKCKSGVVIDIGAGSTDICVIKDNVAVYMVSIPFAGNCLTNDIAQEFELDTQKDLAEDIKIKYAGQYSDPNRKVDEVISMTQENNSNKSIDTSKLHEVLHTRLNEILDISLHFITSTGCTDLMNEKLILTGASSQFTLCKELLEKKAKTKVKVYNDWYGSYGFPNLSASALGLLYTASDNCQTAATIEEPTSKSHTSKGSNSIVQSIKNFFYPAEEADGDSGELL